MVTVAESEKENEHVCEEIFQLLEDGEDYKDLLNLEHEKMLLRWVNFYLKQVGEKPVDNLGKDLADCVALLYLLN